MKRKKKIAEIILYSIVFIFCLSDKRLWIMALLFLAFVVLNIYTCVKHRNDAPAPTKIILKKINGSRKTSRSEKNAYKKLRRQQYNEFLEKIDEEFDFDYEDEDGEI